MKLIREYIEAKVEIKGVGAGFKVGYYLDTNLKSVKEFKPGMYGDIKTSDSNTQDEPTKIEKPNSPIKKVSAKKIEESIKHLSGRNKKELWDKFRRKKTEAIFDIALSENVMWLIQMLIETGRYVNLDVDDKRDGLIFAAANGDYEIVKQMLDNGADPRDVNLGYIGYNIIPLIKQYRKMKSWKKDWKPENNT